MEYSLFIKLVFGVGAAIMYAPLYLLGIEDYYLVSIYICLIALPIICSLHIIYTFLRVRGVTKYLYALLVLLSFGCCYVIYQRYFGAYGLESIETNKFAIFNLCKEDLECVAQCLKTDYYTVNVLIYMLGFPLILLFNYLILRYNRK